MTRLRTPSRLRSALGHDQHKLVSHANGAADAAERVVREVWDELLAAMKHGGHPSAIAVRVSRILKGLANRITAGLAEDFRRVAREAHSLTVDSLAEKLPEHVKERAMREEGELQEAISASEFSAKIIPAPSEFTVNGIIFQSDWRARIDALTHLASPDLLSGIISAGFAEGKTIAEIAKDVRPAVQGVQSSARRVARTEGVRVAHEVQMEAYDQLGDLVIAYQIHAVHGNPYSREWHVKRDGTVYYKKPGPGQKGFDKMPRPPMEAPDVSERPAGTPQVAPNCILPGAIVEGTFEAASKARYAGQAVDIKTRMGRTLSVTINHPVLTTGGFVAAGQLKEGDQLVCHVGEDQLALPSVDEQNGPTLIQEAFRSFEQLGATSVERCTVFDFHGDARDFVERQVEIVGAYGKLRSDLDSQATDGTNESVVRRTGSDQCGLVESSPLELRLVSVLHAATGDMRGRDPTLTSGGSDPAVLRQLRFGRAAELDASRYENPVESGGGLVGVSRLPTTDAEFIGKLFHRFAGQIATDDLVEIRHFDFAGHVYDLQSPFGWIVADSIFISNCLCYLTPVLDI